MPRYNVSLDFCVSVVLERDGDEFHAYCPALKGLHVSGTTEKEAISNAKDAACAYLESLIKHKDPIPVGVIIEKQTMEEVPSLGSKHYPQTKDLMIACAI